MPIGHLCSYFGKHIYPGLCLVLNQASIFFDIESSELFIYFGHQPLIECHARPCAQSRPALCDPVDCSPPGSSVHRVFQAGILEWVAIPSSRVFFQPKHRICVSRVSCIGRWILYHCTTWECPLLDISFVNIFSQPECLQIRAIFSFPIFLIFKT